MGQTIPPTICLDCNHYLGTYILNDEPDIVGDHLNYCKAYPKDTEDGIPHEILMGDHDHKEPYKGDHGIQFEPIKETQ